MPFNPTLVIGLGGQGQWVACHLLKELMELSNVQTPQQLEPSVQILSLDTDSAPRASVLWSGGQTARSGEHQVTLPGTNCGDLGEDVKKYVEEARDGKHPELARWFPASWFLDHPNKATILNLSLGARAYRPLGRISVFYGLTHTPQVAHTPQGENSPERNKQPVRDLLQRAIARIPADAGNTPLNVCIAGSLCGGTCAGMAADIAYLVRQLAAPRSVSVRGYFLLPGAFKGTIAADSSFLPRSFAAMRELRRFSEAVRSVIGYPMHYAGPDKAADGILRGRLEGTLFESLYYFDHPLGLRRRDGGIDEIEIKNGIAPLIAEAIMLWIDDQAGGHLGGHQANVAAKQSDLIRDQVLRDGAAVAGGVGVYSLQLPLYPIVESWAHDLGLRALEEFLGVRAGDVDDTTRVVRRLDEGHGREAARNAWRTGNVANHVLTSLTRDVLETGRALILGGGERDTRRNDLNKRVDKDEIWEDLLLGGAAPSEADQALRSQFLHPPQVDLEKRGLLPGHVPVRRAMVATTGQLSGGAAKQEKKNPGGAAERIEREVKLYLDKHLGSEDAITRARGGNDDDPAGEYPRMLRRWAEEHRAPFQSALLAWVAQSLNEADPTTHSRWGRFGATVALLDELSSMLTLAVAEYQGVEKKCLDIVATHRDSLDAKEAVKGMSHAAGGQEGYLRFQQEKVLLPERSYAAARQVRWWAQQMLDLVEAVKAALQAWREDLAGGLYSAISQGLEHVDDTLRGLVDYAAVRDTRLVVNSRIRDERRDYYEEQAGGIDSVLDDLGWAVAVDRRKERDARGREKWVLQVDMKLSLKLKDGPKQFLTNGTESNRAWFLERCRNVFAEAWTNESILDWLRRQYPSEGQGIERQNLAFLVGELQGLAKPPLRWQPEAHPYTLAYVRAKFVSNDERRWLEALKGAIAGKIGADPQQSQLIQASDPFRLTLVTLHELIDVDQLTSYEEGKQKYDALPAESPGLGTSRQLVHVFAAERNAALYEKRLDRFLPDRVVTLLEDRDRFRLFVQAWAYGKVADGEEILLHSHCIPGSDPALDRRGKWVRRLTTGPFEEEIDPITGEAVPAQHLWLTPPMLEVRPLFEAAEAFLSRGEDVFKDPQKPKPIDDGRVAEEIQRRKHKLVVKPVVDGTWASNERNRVLAGLVEGFKLEGQKKAGRQLLAEYEYLQGLQLRLQNEIIPAIGDDPLEEGLLQVMGLVLADDMATLRQGILNIDPTEGRGASTPGRGIKPDY
ncbi:MAG TPA: tubulin-like doman-containing protein [Anaerolineae bacterium]|nr:tubulin-like doman-containing protein [Anaerolineae bacterium]